MGSRVDTITTTTTNTNAAQDQAVVLAQGAQMTAINNTSLVDSEGVTAAFRFATENSNRSAEGVEHLIGAVEEMAEMTAGALQQTALASTSAIGAAYQNANRPAVDIEKITPWLVGGFFAVGLAAWGMNRGRK